MRLDYVDGHAYGVAPCSACGAQSTRPHDSFVRYQLPGDADHEDLNDYAVTTFCLDALARQMARSRQNET